LQAEIIRANEPELIYAHSRLVKTSVTLLYHDKYILNLIIHNKPGTQAAGEKYNAKLHVLETFFLVAEFENPFALGEYFEVSQMIKDANGRMLRLNGVIA
jgi:hypothetical protein